MNKEAVRLAIERVLKAKNDKDMAQLELKSASAKVNTKVNEYEMAVGNFGTVAENKAHTGVVYNGVLYRVEGCGIFMEIPVVDAPEIPPFAGVLNPAKGTWEWDGTAVSKAAEYMNNLVGSGVQLPGSPVAPFTEEPVKASPQPPVTHAGKKTGKGSKEAPNG